MIELKYYTEDTNKNWIFRIKNDRVLNYMYIEKEESYWHVCGNNIDNHKENGKIIDILTYE